jgi:GNAT superfamily N-acetyltransferase
MTQIRSAVLKDASAIAWVQVQTWQRAYRGIVADNFLDRMSVEDRAKRWFELLQQQNSITFVAAPEGQQIIGFANGGPERDGRKDFQAELYGLYVHPNWQRQGIGKRLVAPFVDWLLKSDRKSMIVWTLADSPFRRFYEGLGGQLVGQRDIGIGHQNLVEVAYGWEDLWTLANGTTEQAFEI